MYLTVDKEHCGNFEVSKSKFLYYIKPITDFDDGIDYLKSIQKKHSDATHNCYAIVGSPESNMFKYSDDGEPNQTAGLPIFNIIQANRLYNVALIVTRYFGGIKLGANGLVTNYTKAAKDAVNLAKIVKTEKALEIEIELDYSAYENFCYKLNAFTYDISDKTFQNRITITVLIPIEQAEEFTSFLNSFTNGKSNYKIIKEKYYQFI